MGLRPERLAVVGDRELGRLDSMRQKRQDPPWDAVPRTWEQMVGGKGGG